MELTYLVAGGCVFFTKKVFLVHSVKGLHQFRACSNLNFNLDVIWIIHAQSWTPTQNYLRELAENIGNWELDNNFTVYYLPTSATEIPREGGGWVQK